MRFLGRQIAIGAGVIGLGVYVAWAGWVVASVARVMPKPQPIVQSRFTPECDALIRRVESKVYGIHKRTTDRPIEGEMGLFIALGRPSGGSQSGSKVSETGVKVYTWALERRIDGEIAMRSQPDGRGGRWIADVATASIDSKGKVVNLEVGTTTRMDEAWCERALR